MKKVLLMIAIALLPMAFSAQTVLMEEYPGNDTIVPKWGKNLKHFIHFYFSCSVIADDFSNSSAGLKFPSGDFSIGIRYKRKITNFYAMGLDLSMNNTGYGIKQEDGKIFPDSGIVYDKQSINMGALSMEYYNRINFDRRGNKIGKFIDIGAYGFFNVNSWCFTRMEFDTLNVGYSKKVEAKYFKPDYLNNYGYGASVRIGYNAVVLSARYRLSDLVKTDKYKGFPELPRLMVGLQLSIH